MFNVLFLFSVVGGLGLGVWLSMRHAEIYYRLLKTSENSTFSSFGDLSDTYYDTGQVNNVEANSEENLDENLSLPEDHVIDESNFPSDQEITGEPEMQTSGFPLQDFADPVVEESDSIALFSDDSDNQETTAPSPESSLSVQESEEFVPVVETISELIGFSKTWPDSEVAQEMIQMISRESSEMETLASLYDETQNMLVEFENVAPDVMETQWISNVGDVKYVNRIICRPRLG